MSDKDELDEFTVHHTGASALPFSACLPFSWLLWELVDSAISGAKNAEGRLGVLFHALLAFFFLLFFSSAGTDKVAVDGSCRHLQILSMFWSRADFVHIVVKGRFCPHCGQEQILYRFWSRADFVHIVVKSLFCTGIGQGQILSTLWSRAGFVHIVVKDRFCPCFGQGQILFMLWSRADFVHFCGQGKIWSLF